MPRQIFVNLAVSNLKKSIEFFTSLGFEFNPQFSDETGTCMIVSEHIYVMLLTEAKFQTFIPHAISNAKKATEVLVCLNAESRQSVDDIVVKAVAAGGTTFSAPQDHGFLYGHSFQDLDGHIWEFVYMDPTAMPS